MPRGPALPLSPWLRAGAYLVLAVGLSNLLLLDSVERELLAPFRRGVASAAAAALELLGAGARAYGDRVDLARGAVQIVDACTGLDVSVLLAAAMLVFPATWRARLLGIAAGTALVLALNFARVLSLALLVGSSPAWFEFAHVYVWPALVAIAALAALLAWIARAAPREA